MRIGDLTIRENYLSVFSKISTDGGLNVSTGNRIFGKSFGVGMSEKETKKTLKLILTKEHLRKKIIFIKTESQNGIKTPNDVKRLQDVYLYIDSLKKPRTAVKFLFEKETTKIHNDYYVIENVSFSAEQGDINFHTDTYTKIELSISLVSTEPPRSDGFGIIQNEVIEPQYYDINTTTANNLNKIQQANAYIQDSMVKAKEGVAPVQNAVADAINYIQDVKELVDTVKYTVQGIKNSVIEAKETVETLEKMVQNMILFVETAGEASSWEDAFDIFINTAETLNEQLTLSQTILDNVFLLNFLD